MVRAAAKNHANVAVVTSPARYDEVLAALDTEAGLDDRYRRALALEAFAHTAAYDARIASALPGRMVAAGLLDAPADPYPADADDRPREGRDAALRREPAPAGRPLPATRARRSPTASSRSTAPRSRARRCPTTTSSTRPRPRRSGGRCAGRASSSSSTPTRAARRSARPSPTPGTRPSRPTRSARSAASSR